MDPYYLATAIDAALDAGRVHRRYFRRDPDVHKKGPIDLVTDADLTVEREFRARISAQFPTHVVLGEEAGGGEGAGSSDPARPVRCRWIIDPLDGTTNFAHGLGLFCVSIALEIDGRVDLGVVYDPVSDELFTAERGAGARLNGAPLSVSNRRDLVDSLVCTGFPYAVRDGRSQQVRVFEAFLGRTRAVRRLGSAALDLCYVAAGRFDGFWEEELHAWDIAAGALIVQEAGGRVTGYDGRPHALFGRTIVATNGHVHAGMLDVIGAVRA